MRLGKRIGANHRQRQPVIGDRDQFIKMMPQLAGLCAFRAKMRQRHGWGAARGPPPAAQPAPMRDPVEDRTSQLNHTTPISWFALVCRCNLVIALTRLWKQSTDQPLEARSLIQLASSGVAGVAFPLGAVGRSPISGLASRRS